MTNGTAPVIGKKFATTLQDGKSQHRHISSAEGMSMLRAKTYQQDLSFYLETGTTPIKATNTPDKFSNTPSKTPSSTGNTQMKGISLYERSMQQKNATESKLKHLEYSMMEQFTFTPDTSKPKVSKKTPDSLRKHTTPNKYNVNNSPHNKSPVRSPISTRVDQLYRDGVRKNQERRMTSKEERAARDCRLQDRDLAECTFHPKMDWKVKKPRNKEDMSVGSTKASRPVKMVDHAKAGMAVSPLSYPDDE